MVGMAAWFRWWKHVIGLCLWLVSATMVGVGGLQANLNSTRLNSLSHTHGLNWRPQLTLNCQTYTQLSHQTRNYAFNGYSETLLLPKHYHNTNFSTRQTARYHKNQHFTPPFPLKHYQSIYFPQNPTLCSTTFIERNTLTTPIHR